MRSFDRRTQPKALLVGQPDAEAGRDVRSRRVAATAANSKGPHDPPTGEHAPLQTTAP